jgi:uncharacterized membrane protein YobD (UPF0266 family)
MSSSNTSNTRVFAKQRIQFTLLLATCVKCISLFLPHIAKKNVCYNDKGFYFHSIFLNNTNTNTYVKQR